MEIKMKKIALVLFGLFCLMAAVMNLLHLLCVLFDMNTCPEWLRFFNYRHSSSNYGGIAELIFFAAKITSIACAIGAFFTFKVVISGKNTTSVIWLIVMLVVWAYITIGTIDQTCQIGTDETYQPTDGVESFR